MLKKFCSSLPFLSWFFFFLLYLKLLCFLVSNVSLLLICTDHFHISPPGCDFDFCVLWSEKASVFPLGNPGLFQIGDTLFSKIWKSERVDTRKRFFASSLAGPHNRLHKEVVMASVLLEFTECVDNALRCKVCFLDSAIWSQKLDMMVLMGMMVLRIFCDSMRITHRHLCQLLKIFMQLC